MKFHWGHGIFLFYGLFVVALVSVVIASTGFDNSLVTEEYYQRDINYQQEFDRRRNSKQLLEPVKLMQENGIPVLHFPERHAQAVSGTVLLYRPSSRADDRLLELELDNNLMRLDTEGMKPGRYVAIVEWSANGVGYYDEIDLFL